MICVPIVGPSMSKAQEQIASAPAVADILELRLDLIADPDLNVLFDSASLPVIATCRSKIDGGQFKGQEEARIQLLRDALRADYVDIEVSTPRELLQPFLEGVDPSKIILSYHDFSHTPEDFNPLYDAMCELPGDIIKIVTYARDLHDNLKMFDLLKRAKQENKKLIGLCMGDLGEISRVLSPLFGGFLTFGSLETGQESAPGQMPAKTLKDIYRVNTARSDFKIYGVIGNPVSKSQGYLVHNKAFEEKGSSDIYVSFRVDNVEKFFHGYKDFFSGLSVTMPAKEQIIPLLDRIDETAGKIGAVNTVVKEGSDWVGYNTDCSGAISALEACTTLQGKNILILGSGGTAKAIGYGVKEKGGRLTVTYNKNKERGESLAKELGCDLVYARDAGIRPIDVLINCSPVGMSPNVNESPFPARDFKEGMVVFDSVYNPLETRLLREAKAAGCTVIPGSELFINQAARQFELWTGQSAPIDTMREVLLKKLKG
ncbi:MAG: shikimate dehydrogenase [Nitrospina sp.]|nr:shikimate dehydrogenase [Nitrospina sp.]MBT3508044.1 shikimate dehydrogenase [Nitrospina sp.]MBT3876571.1 shikimate dehydrogenase [Nitrospina sp.]MBT4049590.1 shikimate dehydrogenase [Nitrospina sp.]MBT4558302.1 shikimate dehydrogenase [Nitrospina sp.]